MTCTFQVCKVLKQKATLSLTNFEGYVDLSLLWYNCLYRWVMNLHEFANCSQQINMTWEGPWFLFFSLWNFPWCQVKTHWLWSPALWFIGNVISELLLMPLDGHLCTCCFGYNSSIVLGFLAVPLPWPVKVMSGNTLTKKIKHGTKKPKCS